MVAFRIELEVVDQRFHRMLHLAARRRRDFPVVHLHRPGRHVLQALPDDLQAFSQLVDAHEIAVVAVAVFADRHIETQAIINVVRLSLA